MNKLILLFGPMLVLSACTNNPLGNTAILYDAHGCAFILEEGRPNLYTADRAPVQDKDTNLCTKYDQVK